MSRKCAKCGMVSETEEAFIQDNKSSYSDKVFYCTTCWEKKTTQQEKAYLLAYITVLIGGFVWVIVSPKNEFAWLVLHIGLFGCFTIVATVFHELGHVLAAFVVRAKIFQVTIGLGRILYRRNFWGIEWQFCIIPICGFVIPSISSIIFYRTRSFLISLGGPLANCFWGAAAMFVLWRTSSPWLAAMVRSFMIANIFTLGYGLWPQKVHFAGQNTSSDGLSLLTIPFMSKSKIKQEIGSFQNL